MRSYQELQRIALVTSTTSCGIGAGIGRWIAKKLGLKDTGLEVPEDLTAEEMQVIATIQAGSEISSTLWSTCGRR